MRIRDHCVFMVMANCLPVDESIAWHKLYDLKGNRDDKTMESEGKKVEAVSHRFFYCGILVLRTLRPLVP